MKSSILATITSLCFSAALSAQDISWGLQTGTIAPVGAISNDSYSGNHKSGLQGGWGGLNISYQVSRLDDIRLVLNSAGLSGQYNSVSPSVDIRNEYYFFQVGSEWDHYFSSRLHGWNTSIGLNITQLHRDMTISSPSPFGGNWGSTFRFSQSKRLGLSLGAGYQFTHWLGAVGSLHRVSLDEAEGGPNGLSKAEWVQLGVVFQFGRR